MFSMTKTLFLNPVPRRFPSPRRFYGKQREYVSMSSCKGCRLLRSKKSGVWNKPDIMRRWYSSSLTENRRVHERWREKQVEEALLSKEAVQTEMIQVLTYKVERMILQNSHEPLPLPLHSANSQSVAEERWTDFDAISVIPQTVYTKESQGDITKETPSENWSHDLHCFKKSLLREKERTTSNVHSKNSPLVKKLSENQLFNLTSSKVIKAVGIINKTSSTNLKQKPQDLGNNNNHFETNVLTESMAVNKQKEIIVLSSEETNALMGDNLVSKHKSTPYVSSNRLNVHFLSESHDIKTEGKFLNLSSSERTNSMSDKDVSSKGFDVEASSCLVSQDTRNNDKFHKHANFSQKLDMLSDLSTATNNASCDISLKEPSSQEPFSKNSVMLPNLEKNTESSLLLGNENFKFPPKDESSQFWKAETMDSLSVSKSFQPVDNVPARPQLSNNPPPNHFSVHPSEPQFSELEHQISETPTSSGLTSVPLNVDTAGISVEKEVGVEEVASISEQSAPPVFLTPKKAKLSKDKKKKKGKESVKKKVVPVHPGDLEKKITQFNQDLLAYLDNSIKGGMVSNAQVTLNYYRYNGSRQAVKKAGDEVVGTSYQKIRDVQVYNLLMHAWAKQGNLDQVKQCFSNMREDGVQPVFQSYAACLECMGRQKHPNVSVTERVIKDIEKDGFDIKDIFNECVFVKDERQIVHKAIKDALPDYEHNGPREIPVYSNVLLDGLLTSKPTDEVVERNPYCGVLTAEDLQSRADHQTEMEVDFDVKVRSVASQSEHSAKCLKMRKILSETEEEWRTMIKNGLDRKLRYMQRKNKDDHGMNLYPYLKLLEIDEYVNLILKEIHLLATESESFSPTSGFLWRRLGHRVHQKSIVQQKVKNKITKKVLKLYKRYSSHYSEEDLGADNHRLCWQELCAQDLQGPTLDQADKSWPFHVVKGLGKLLYDIILYDVKFDSNVLKSVDTRKKIPSFYTVYRNYGQTTKEEIKPHPTLVKIYQGSELEDLTFEARELPMIVPPLPWTSANAGGYLLSSAPLVRLPDQAHGQRQILENTSPDRLYPVLDALNTLSACAWKINKPMLDLIVSVFNDKGNKDLDIPPPVSEAPPVPKLSKSMSPTDRSKVYAERLKVKQQRSEMYSLWCNELYRLSIANKFRDEIFWFPHNLDFRGRTYPCPPHFNHLGSDVVRSILYFAKGKPLGEKGLDWLKIHLVNLSGLKKRSPTSERLSFANSLMEEILDSADKPLTGRKWWQSSDEPWQTLACCREIALAVRSPDHTQFVSYFPVHQDGSCNGLQHYAALGRDQAGAESVNLFPFTEPKDVYSDVAVLVERERIRDALEGSEIAEALEGFVRRKVIKQTVMTTVYGVTRYGAKYQILRQLKDIPEFPQQHVWAASQYLTQKTFHCLQEMFSATKEIQDWLTVSAHLISTVCGKPVEWSTPLGFPIVQPYHKTIVSQRQGIRVYDNNNMFEKPNARKQKNAFPPNFIHSLDSTHMMLTALYCLQAGITYVSVHDCFWTHPCDVETMNKITREQFVALHEQPILEDLSHHLVEKFGSFSKGSNSVLDPTSHHFLDSVLTRVPKKGDFDLNNILKSVYFFS